MAPKDDDQTSERENRIQDMMDGYRRDHPTKPPDNVRPPATTSGPPPARPRPNK